MPNSVLLLHPDTILPKQTFLLDSAYVQSLQMSLWLFSIPATGLILQPGVDGLVGL